MQFDNGSTTLVVSVVDAYGDDQTEFWQEAADNGAFLSISNVVGRSTNVHITGGSITGGVATLTCDAIVSRLFSGQVSLNAALVGPQGETGDQGETGSVDLTNYARKDIGQTFSGNQTFSDNIQVGGGIQTSGGIISASGVTTSGVETNTLTVNSTATFGSDVQIAGNVNSDGDLSALTLTAGDSGGTVGSVVIYSIGGQAITLEGGDAEVTMDGSLTINGGRLSADTVYGGTLEGDGFAITGLDPNKLLTVVPITKGGTGQSTATDAINALVPAQTSNSGKVLGTDGTVVSWVSVPAPSASSITTGTLPDARLSSDVVKYSDNKVVRLDSFTNSFTGGDTALNVAAVGTGNGNRLAVGAGDTSDASGNGGLFIASGGNSPANGGAALSLGGGTPSAGGGVDLRAGETGGSVNIASHYGGSLTLSGAFSPAVTITEDVETGFSGISMVGTSINISATQGTGTLNLESTLGNAVLKSNGDTYPTALTLISAPGNESAKVSVQGTDLLEVAVAATTIRSDVLLPFFGAESPYIVDAGRQSDRAERGRLPTSPLG
jgi:hypothetical protein